MEEKKIKINRRQRVRKFSVKLGVRSVILQCNIHFFRFFVSKTLCSLCCRRHEVWLNTSLEKSLSPPLLRKFFSTLHHFPPLLFWCHELTVLFNVFTVFNDWLHQYWQDPILWKFAGWFPYLWKLWNIFFIPSTSCWKYLMEKGPKCMALASPCPKTCFPPPPRPPPQKKNPHVKAEARCRKNAPVTHIKYVDRWLKNLAFWTWSFDSQNWHYFSWRKILQLSPVCISVSNNGLNIHKYSS
jgi:hypothetical protein